ncbi:bone marrow proteoglycan [Microcaecilia unicolor]|uniref:Bone marrow proteoglycan-like n=1 Tax=Microcaecilia unicolor TaxID=1415580 RepID=A0A6P7WGC1_9AMPH|nr:bone marrow proteoglycan-like [Microcaecilia unicolor]XP_030042287.1 bone marrow proteoglycan-like [Microcaecilia unicolor]
MKVYMILLLLLLGTTSAQESGEEDLEELGDNEMDLLTEEESTAEEEEEEETTPLASDCQEECGEKKILIESSKLCNGSETCQYLIILCHQTFQQAQRTCRCHKGQLTSISNQCVNQSILSRVFAQNTRAPSFWIGLQKSSGHQRFRWVDGRCLTYQNWANGEPRRCGQQCVTMDKRSGKWCTSNCNARRPFICRI